MKAAADSSVGDRDTSQLRHGHRRGDTGHDLPGDLIFLQSQDLLPAPSEHKGISAFQTDYRKPLLRQTDKQPADLFLAHRVAASLLSYIDLPAAGL